MLKASGAMAGATLSSRVLGMVREMVYGCFMGTTWVASAFLLAFQVPNLFRRLLGEGALTAAFIPIFKEKEKIHGEEEMWRAANAVISGLIIFTCVVVVVGMVAVSGALLFGGHVENGATRFTGKTLLMLQLLRVMLPYLVLVCLAAVFMGMLNARGHFFIPAMGATMLNVVMIASVLFLAPKMGWIFRRRRGCRTRFSRWPSACWRRAWRRRRFNCRRWQRDGFRYPLGFAVAGRNRAARRKTNAAGDHRRGGVQINVVLTQGLSYWVDYRRHRRPQRGRGIRQRLRVAQSNRPTARPAAIGLALWAQRLNLMYADGQYADVAERAMLNGVLSGAALDGRHFFYVNPLASKGGHHRQPFFDCACCPTNLVRFIPSIPGYVYATGPDGVYVNLYASGSGKVRLGTNPR